VGGGKLDGKYPGTKVWEAFGDRVGWREQGGWMSYKALTKGISLSTQKGKFPVILISRGWRGGGVVGVFSSLALRLVNCSTQQS
jgi:hypothetical protein